MSLSSKKIEYLLRSEAIDNKYYTDQELGAIYSSKETNFKLWAPTASEAYVIEYKGDSKVLHKMTKDIYGVYSKKIKGNLDGFEYNYEIHFDNVVNETVDPYATAATANGKRSVVLNMKKTNPKKFNRLKSFGPATDAIIYELSVRDFSIDKNSKFKNKGKFLALCEKRAIKYFKSLGITHIQLLPIYDFSESSVDELNPSLRYNWGYDPVNYNVVEGSYSTDPRDPACRIKELKKMINTLHKNGIRVIMDVVYNHVFDAMQHSFEKTVPNYAFRKDENGNFSNGSACGNDVASNNKMIRKYIVDSVCYWAKEYNLDGFRFDLMGIIDTYTMNEIRSRLDKIDKGIIILGEGWDLNTDLDDNLKSTQKNADKLKNIAFFSDDFRNAIKGQTYEKVGIGFISGKTNKINELENIIKANKGFYTYTAPNQVVQYVEAHDNYTMYDHLSIVKPKESLNSIKKMHLIATSLVLTSQGISFLHAGQEFFRTKQGVENSYKSSDEINKFDWELVKKNKKSIQYVSDLISLRKKEKLFRLETYDMIDKNFKLLSHSRSFFAYELGNEYLIIVNTSKKYKKVKLDHKYELITSNFKFSKKKSYVEKSINVKSLNFVILKKYI